VCAGEIILIFPAMSKTARMPEDIIKGFIMGYRINTNVAAMNSLAITNMNNRSLDNSLSKLSSGLRINKAADDASGMAIADSLRAQSSGLGQAVSNANDAIGIVQIADKAMDEQIKILETIRTKATQAAQDGQTSDTRAAIQKDINRLLESLDNISASTTFNGQSLLAGSFTNKEFQVGAFSNQTVNASIGATGSSKIGHVHYETGIGALDNATSDVSLTFSSSTVDVRLESVSIDYSAGSGLGALADVINKSTQLTGVKASYVVESNTTAGIGAGDLSSITLNGVLIGDISGVEANDSDGRLVQAINKLKEQTGVEATVDGQGRLTLHSGDGRGIVFSAAGSAALAGAEAANYGRLTLSRQDARDIAFTVSTAGGAGALSDIGHAALAETTLNLANVRANITSADALAIGKSANASTDLDLSGGIGAGVTSLKGAMAVMELAQSAQKTLDSIRADLGSVQNQLVSTVNNISVTQVNVKAAESNIRDVDFAKESAQFSKLNILSQAGAFALSQANNVQQNVLRLLQ